MQIDDYANSVPSWVDLSTPDVDGAVAFYSAFFGWDVPESAPEFGGYRMAMTGDRPVAGFTPQMSPGPPAWMTYVNVDDADEVAGRVPANAGQVLMAPLDVGDVGRMAIFADPAGAVVGVWQAGRHKGAGVVNEPGTYCWSELVTTDVAGATDFYRAVFGWDAETSGAGPAAYTEWQVGGRSVGGMMQKPTTMPADVPPHWGVYFAVADTDEALARIDGLGGTVVMGATDIEPGRFAVLADPSGAPFQVLALKEGQAG